MNALIGGSNNTALTIKSSPPKTAQVMTRLGVRAGMLTKRNEQQVWQRRFCALVPQTLLYYFEDESSESARGIIDLEYYTEIEIIAERTIRLSTPPDIPLRAFYFRAETEEQCAHWAAVLKRERYFYLVEERDEYFKLQSEFQKESQGTAERIMRLTDEISQRRAVVEQSEARRRAALDALREQAVELGLDADAASSLRDAKGALVEVAHRLHYHMRRSSQLESSIAGHDDDGGGVTADSNAGEEGLRTCEREDDDDDDDGGDGASEEESAARLRALEELRSELSVAKMARHRESATRRSLESEKYSLRSLYDELQQRVSVAARVRVSSETKATELNEQKRILVREIKSTRRAIAEQDAATADLQREPPLSEDSCARDLDDEHDAHRDLALKRAGLRKSGARLGTRSETESEDASSTDRDQLGAALLARATSWDGVSKSVPRASAASARSTFALVCKRCAGTVEGPQFSTCTCAEPSI